MAIKPPYAKLIRDGKKTVELRRLAPKVTHGDILVIYESAPICKVTAFAEIDYIIKLAPEDLWNCVSSTAIIDKAVFDAYFAEKKLGNGICIKNVIDFPVPKSLNILPNHTVPQNFRYLSERDFLQLQS